MTVGLCVVGGIQQEQTDLRRTFSSGFKVTMSPAASSYMENIEPRVEGGSVSIYTGEPLNIETIRRIADCQGVISYTAAYNAAFCSNDIIPVPGLHYDRLHNPERRPQNPDELARSAADCSLHGTAIALLFQRRSRSYRGWPSGSILCNLAQKSLQKFL